MNPFQTVVFERKLAEEGRAQTERVNRGADIMNKPGQGQLSRARPASEGIVRFYDKNRQAFLRKADSRGEPVGTRTNDDRIVGDVLRHCRVCRRRRKGTPVK
jgi:hypothetical protein